MQLLPILFLEWYLLKSTESFGRFSPKFLRFEEALTWLSNFFLSFWMFFRFCRSKVSSKYCMLSFPVSIGGFSLPCLLVSSNPTWIALSKFDLLDLSKF